MSQSHVAGECEQHPDLKTLSQRSSNGSVFQGRLEFLLLIFCERQLQMTAGSCRKPIDMGLAVDMPGYVRTKGSQSWQRGEQVHSAQGAEACSLCLTQPVVVWCHRRYFLLHSYYLSAALKHCAAERVLTMRDSRARRSDWLVRRAERLEAYFAKSQMAGLAAALHARLMSDFPWAMTPYQLRCLLLEGDRWDDVNAKQNPLPLSDDAMRCSTSEYHYVVAVRPRGTLRDCQHATAVPAAFVGCWWYLLGRQQFL